MARYRGWSYEFLHTQEFFEKPTHLKCVGRIMTHDGEQSTPRALESNFNQTFISNIDSIKQTKLQCLLEQGA